MLLLAFAAPAWAACSLNLQTPANNTLVTTSPTFAWVGNCVLYRVQFSPSGDFSSDLSSTAYQNTRTYTYDATSWTTLTTAWGSDVVWRVEGLDGTGVSTISSTRTLRLSPDEDADGWTVVDGDCDDTVAEVYPGAPEDCDGGDQDCDGVADNGLEFLTWYLDVDEDGYGDAASFVTTCDGAPAGFVADDTDCDDADVAVNPGEEEICGDGIDQNCNDSADTCSILGNVAAGTSDVRVRGYRGYQLGPALVLGDVNGDGEDDLLATTYTRPFPRNQGAVYGWFGPLDGSESLGNADFRIEGSAYGQYFGHYTSVAGDVNGDGWPDLLVSGQDTTTYGKTWLFLGPITPGVHRATEAAATFAGYTAGDYAYVSSPLGDLDGDGYDDFAIGAWGFSDSFASNSGWVDVWYGPVTGTWYLGEGDISFFSEGGSGAGYSMRAGDFDGDGESDLAILSYVETERFGGATGGSAGTVRICYGPDLWGGLLTEECPFGVGGSRASALLGYGAVNSLVVSDLDLDGMDDIVIGSTNDADYALGATYGCFGPFDSMSSVASCGLVVRGASPLSADLGSRNAVGDLNGDGVPDLAMADLNGRSPADSSTVGTVGVLFGPLAGRGTVYSTSLDALVYGGEVTAQLGANLGIYDLNHDGVGDLTFGAPGMDASGTDAGELRVFFGGSL